METIEIIREVVNPAVLKIVLVSVPEETRVRGLTERGEGDATAIATVDAHSSEQQVASLLGEFADLVLGGDKPTEAVVAELADWIRNQ